MVWCGELHVACVVFCVTHCHQTVLNVSQRSDLYLYFFPSNVGENAHSFFFVWEGISKEFVVLSSCEKIFLPASLC